MYKDIVKFIAILVLISTYALSIGKQIQLNNGMWQAVGFQGIYELDQSSSSWDTDLSNALEDRADDNTTYIVGDVVANDNFYVDINNNRSLNFISNTAPFHATIGIFAIEGTQSRKASNYITLDGSSLNSVHLKIQDIKPKVNHIPMYRMYVEGKDNIPTIRIDYQGDYEGVLFRVKFGSELESYYSYFNSSSTYAHPADLHDETTVHITKSGPISHTVDFNITDNNLTLLEQNQFKILNTDGTVGGDGILSYNSGRGDAILIYHYGEGRWKIFNSTNVNVGSNDFEQFTPGQGYWVKADSKNAHSDGNQTKIGLLTKGSSDLLNTDYYKGLQVGWNMVSFPDTYLRYATTGMFVPYHEINATGVNLFFGRHASTIGVDVNHTRDINITLDSSHVFNTTDVVQKINTFVVLRELLYGEPIILRAFPAMTQDGNGSEGVMVVSNSRFETNSSNSTTITGQPLTATSGGLSSTVFGEYILGLDLNDISPIDINASIDFFIPSSGTRKFNAVGAATGEINNTTTLTQKHLLVEKLDDALKQAATPVGKSTPTTTSKVYLIDFDFESNESIRDYNDTDSYRSILVSAGARFFVRDETYTKVFRIENNGTFLIQGDIDIKVTSGNVTGATGLGVVDSINQQTNTTNVVATSLGDNYVSITSPSKRNLDLLENDDKTLFLDIGLQNLNIPSSSSRYTKGVITKVYTFLNLLTPEIVLDADFFTGTNATLPRTNVTDINISDSGSDATGTYKGSFPSASTDLRENSVWAIDFPSNSIIEKLASYNKEMTSIMTMNTSPDNGVYWSFIDLTKSPDSWYIQNGIDTQDVFHLYNQKAYWVNVRDKTFIPSSQKQVDKSTSVYQKQVVSHFNNTLNNGIGLTTNHIDHTLNIKFNKAFIDPLQNPYYDVMAIISGQEYRLQYNGTGFQIRLNSSTINLQEKNSTEPHDAIILKVYDGLGNNLIETPTKHTYEIEYFKPAKPDLLWDKDGELVLKSNTKTTAEYYLHYISDIEIERNKAKIQNTKLSENEKELGWIVGGGIIDGSLKKIRVVAKAATTHNQNFYSDSVGFLYAPLKYGHALSVAPDPKLPKTSLVPYSFIQKQRLTPVDANGKFPKANAFNTINNGVQVTLLKHAIDLKKGVQMVYYPDITGNGVKEGDKRLTSFGGNYTMYLKVSTKNNTTTKPIAKITYINSYAGKIFYIYYDNTLYQGVFQGNSKYNSDVSAYNMHSGTLGVSFDTAGTEGHRVGFASSSVLPSQPIVIPGVDVATTTTSVQPPPIP